MYRLRLRMTPDGLGFVIGDRDVARLCLAEGDELVVAEIVRNPAVAPVEPRPAEPSAAVALAPVAPTLGDRPEQTARDKSAFRTLGR